MYRSPRFVVGEFYGTRTSTVAMFRAEGGVEYIERSFDRLGVATGTSVQRITTQPPACARAGLGPGEAATTTGVDEEAA